MKFDTALALVLGLALAAIGAVAFLTDGSERKACEQQDGEYVCFVSAMIDNVPIYSCRCLRSVRR